MNDLLVNSLFLDPCIEEGTDLMGNGVGWSNEGWDHFAGVPNVAACQKRCQDNSKCHYWTFGVTIYKNECWLKKSDSGREPRRGLISGRKYCGELN